MKYNMKKPCKSCPFVRGHDFYLNPERVEEIRDNRGEFPCHKTVDYSDDGPSPYRDTSEERHCYGHLVLQWHDWKGFNQLQAMAARMGLFDPRKLPAPKDIDVYDSWDEMIQRMEDW